MTIDITKITNQIVRRALQSRNGDFIFNYGDGGSRHDPDTGEEIHDIHLFPRKTHYEEHNDYKDYSDG